MGYDKQIRYLEYFEGGSKIKSAGFVKIELMDRFCNVQVNVTGLYPTENCSREVHISGMGPGGAIDGIFGEIVLQSGRGSLIRRQMPADRLCDGIGYDDLTYVRINLGKNRELVCRWREEEVPLPEVAPMVSEEEPVPEPAVWADPLPVERPETETIPAVQLAAEPELAPEPEPESEPEPEETVSEELPAEPDLLLAESVPKDIAEQIVRPKKFGPAVPSPLHEKKWRQLAEIYPHIAPFRDERDYLTIGPGDFVILPEKYYRLINNSFLLHGFYNYGHMVLARNQRRGEERYYIGVPGNFYEKERQAALMFGFESFECRQEPARDGDFGYFMIRVEL